MNVLGIVGNLGSGKDTVASIFVDKYGFQRISMADPFKRFARRVFSFSDEQLWGPSHFRNEIDKRYGDKIGNISPYLSGSTRWIEAHAKIHEYGREWIRLVLAPTSLPLGEVDKGGAGTGSSFEDQVETAFEALVEWFHWLSTHYTNNLSPRVVLQSLGSEWGRAKVHQDIWVNYAVSSTQYMIINGAIGVVLSDIRLQNELDAIKAAKGKLIRIIRPETDKASTQIGLPGHESETQQATFSDNLFDFLVHNDGSLKDLEDAIHVYATCLGLAEVTT